MKLQVSVTDQQIKDYINANYKTMFRRTMWEKLRCGTNRIERIWALMVEAGDVDPDLAKSRYKTDKQIQDYILSNYKTMTKRAMAAEFKTSKQRLNENFRLLDHMGKISQSHRFREPANKNPITDEQVQIYILDNFKEYSQEEIRAQLKISAKRLIDIYAKMNEKGIIPTARNIAASRAKVRKSASSLGWSDVQLCEYMAHEDKTISQAAKDLNVSYNSLRSLYYNAKRRMGIQQAERYRSQPQNNVLNMQWVPLQHVNKRCMWLGCNV